MKLQKMLGLMLVVAAVLVAGCTTSEPPAATPTPTPTPATTPTPAMKTIVETAEDAGSFTTLLTAVDAAGLTDTLSGEGPYTVFAPTDDAFAALPEGTVDTLLEDPEGQLTDILLYHVADGKYMAADVITMDTIDTLQGSVLTIDTSDGVMVDSANVIITDVECSNGVIHVIDAVMIPPEA
ncbi:fasciclin domain-containing protein [Methanogenium organophilum]|uniref:Fasciclin domain-containing protein n=1 Tax=Methanogenium organophilum TaxID=2199 RepID=A0A9X9S2T8_METOG|nr:fasciclin domain-containing protein [Methanogenium organophilum]WAI00465.1 fasciclin domain-containing protein [Methanogenium organophilum]